MKYVDPTGEWFGFDDVFTGPIDEIVVIAGLTLYGAFLIYNSETNKNFTDAFAESFNSNLEKIKIILSKKRQIHRQKKVFPLMRNLPVKPLLELEEEVL